MLSASDSIENRSRAEPGGNVGSAFGFKLSEDPVCNEPDLPVIRLPFQGLNVAFPEAPENIALFLPTRAPSVFDFQPFVIRWRLPPVAGFGDR